MKTLPPLALIEEFFRRVASATDEKEIAELVSDEVDWLVAGDVAAVPWIGRKHNKAGAADFYRQIREQLTAEKFEVDTLLAQGARVVAIGSLASRVNRTGKLIETEFVLDFTVADGLISRFRMFEDSFAVAQACN